MIEAMANRVLGEVTQVRNIRCYFVSVEQQRKDKEVWRWTSEYE